MAACAATWRLAQLGTGSCRTHLFGANRFESRPISELAKSNGKRLFLVDTLALDHHFSLLQHETEKLKSDIEKMRSELRNAMMMDSFRCSTSSSLPINEGIIHIFLDWAKAQPNIRLRLRRSPLTKPPGEFLWEFFWGNNSEYIPFKSQVPNG
ncbi:unnamed protein product [Fraxinus pennsylvanica]|uniref:Uncharacterized protein n=1 Tax=Fraxinus pennsylvanica TaxID=56036 RepID=A0AAD1ZXZ6_9LAMI|nr:unnamed protein product [Fraxinus pennsylvanica]